MTIDELIDTIIRLEVPMEMFDFLEVIDMGAKKYALNDWLNQDAKSVQRRNNYGSLQRHLSSLVTAEAQNAPELRFDKESELHHALHIACRALMEYTRDKRGLNV